MSTRSAVLLMAYGGPDSLDDVEPYLLDVRGGRPTSPEFIEEIRSRYALIGGRSPLLERTREQAAALQREMEIPVYVGMRHWKPFIAETIELMVRDGVERVVAIAMAPQYSRMSVGAYRRKVEEAVAKSGGHLEVRFVDSWHDHPLFFEAVAEKVRAARKDNDEGAIIFTAHSLPERILQDGDPYHDHFLASAAGVARLLDLREWFWAYQSQGSTTDKWLGPDVGTVLDGLREHGRDSECGRPRPLPRASRARGSEKREARRLAERARTPALPCRDVLIVPIGFVCDHIEVLYDIDIYYRDYSRERGMSLRRTESLNASPAFIRAVAAIARDHLS